MAEILSGADALDALNQSDNGGNNEFASFKSGTTYVVKVIGTQDLIRYFNYGVFKKVDSFVPKNPSKKSKKGYPVENLTPWDKAWKYHKDQSEEFNDHHSKESYKYGPKTRFTLGFIDLDSGKPIVIDLSKKQAQAVTSTIKENADKLDKLSFKLAKKGESTGTTVSLTPYVNVDNVSKMKQAGIEVDEDLSDEQNKNFKNAPAEFDMSLFEGLSYEADEKEQIQLLDKAGFDVALIGLEVPEDNDGQDNEEAGEIPEGPGSGENGEIQDSDLPF